MNEQVRVRKIMLCIRNEQKMTAWVILRRCILCKWKENDKIMNKKYVQETCFIWGMNKKALIDDWMNE